MTIAAIIFAILSAGCYLAHYLFKYYAANVEVLGILHGPIVWVSIAFAAVAGVLLVVLMIKEKRK